MTAQQLKNSILQMAVQGKLVPQDPNDEPASVLLEKIRKEKEALIKAGKIKREKNPSVIFRGADNLPYAFSEKIGNEIKDITDEIPFEIPNSWEWVRLSQLVYNHGQMTPKNDFCYIDIGSIDNVHQCLNEKETIIAASKAPSRARKIIETGDIIYATVRPYLHNTCIIDRPFSKAAIASTGFAVMSCYAGILNYFLLYYLLSPDFDSYANNADNAKGVAYPAINDDRLYKALVPLPPLSEQNIIVQNIDELLPHLVDYDVVEQKNTALSATFPDRLKKSILQYAVQGKLVPQDPADEPASVLLERIRVEKEQLIKAGKIKRDKHESVIIRRDNSHYEKLNGIERCIDAEIPFDIPDSWAWVRLSTIANVKGGKRVPKGYSLTDTTTAHIYIRVTDMKNGSIINDKLKYIDDSVFQRIKNYTINSTDLYLTIAGTIGNVGSVPEVFDNMNLTENAVKITDIQISKDYLKLLVSSELVQQQFVDKTNKVAQPKLAIERILTTYLPLPPNNEQHRIVTAINDLFPKINTI